MTKYLRDQPFQVGGSTEAYRTGWDRIFGKKCLICDGKGEIEICTDIVGFGVPSRRKETCHFCGGSGKERPPS